MNGRRILWISTALALASFARVEATASKHCMPWVEKKDSNLQVVFDARAEPGKRFLRCRKGTPDPTAFYKTEQPVDLRIKAPRCGTLYRIEVGEIEIPEVGLSIRGLEDAEGLIDVIPAPPPAKGVELLERASIADRTLTDILGQLTTWQQATEYRLELEEELAGLRQARRQLERRIEKYRSTVDRQDQLREIWRKARGLTGELDAFRAKADNPGCEDFRKGIRRTNELLAEVRRQRRAFEASPEAYAAKAIPREITELEGRIETFRRKLERTKAAVEVARELSGELTAAAQLEHLKRLLAQYSEVAEQSYLLDLARSHVASGDRDRELKAIAELASTGLGRTGSLADLLDDLEEDREDLAGKASAWKSDVEAFNREALQHGVFEALEELHQEARGQDSIQTLDRWETNQRVSIDVFEKKTLELPKLATLQDIAPADGRPVVESGDAEPAPGFVHLEQLTFEVHRTTRVNVGGGIYFSSLEDPDFVVRPFQRLDSSGEIVTGDDGNPILDRKLVRTGEDDLRLEYGLALAFYLPREFDTFPGAQRQAYGLGIGFSFDEPDESFFLGGFYQPTPGIQIFGGFHLGRQQIPEMGIVPEVTVLPVDTVSPPVREDWETDTFISVVFDIRVFRRLFGGGGP